MEFGYLDKQKIELRGQNLLHIKEKEFIVTHINNLYMID